VEEYWMDEFEEDWEEDSFCCPECGGVLSHKLVKGENGTVNVAFWCEGAGEDLFSFEISTGLMNKDLKKLEGKACQERGNHNSLGAKKRARPFYVK
jgi:hypothetical protein